MSDWGVDPNILDAVGAIRTGGVIAYPTEAVYGLGCDPDSQQACQQILNLKQREQGMGLILIASTYAQLEPYFVGLTEKQVSQLRASWPGPVTWLIPDNGAAGEWITGGRDTLAVRVTDHPIAAALCESYGGPVVSTSANPHGQPPARSAREVNDYFPKGLSAIVDGPLGAQAKPTEIRHLLTDEVIRSG